MPFVRRQGRRIQILHSRRVGRTVRQIKLHEFRTPEELHELLRTPARWTELCDSMMACLSGEVRFDREALLGELTRLAETIPDAGTAGSLTTMASGLADALEALKAPLPPSARRDLIGAQPAFRRLVRVIPRVLKMATQYATTEKEATVNLQELKGSATTLLDKGLDHYERGEWAQAKRMFVAGVQKNPTHVDLLVHAALSESLDGNHSLALEYLMRAVPLGREDVEKLIRKDPTLFRTSEMKRREVEMLTCKFPLEHESLPGVPCEECAQDFTDDLMTFRSNLETRPFLRALGNRAHVYMDLKRYDDALKDLHEYLRYEDDPRWHNVIGRCHLEVGRFDEAEKWLRTMLWASACYERAFVMVRLARIEQALSYLIWGICWNRHMGDMLLGREKPDPTNWIGDVLPPRLEASRFIRKDGRKLARDARYVSLVRLVRDDSEIRKLVDQVEEANQRKESDRNYRMDDFVWKLVVGSPPEELLKEHAHRLAQETQDPSGQHWLPPVGEILTATLLEALTVNWKLKLSDRCETIIYLKRPAGAIPPPDGSTLTVCVTKAWRYRKSAFITGTIGPTTAQPRGQCPA